MTILNDAAELARNILLTILLRFSPLDVWTVEDAITGGALITGSPGSGKSSTSGKQIALAFLNAGFGGLVLCAKPDEARVWMEYLRQTGRAQDAILFNRESGLHFDPLAYEFGRQGRGAGDIEAIIDLLNVLVLIGRPYGGSSREPFWDSARERNVRNDIGLLAYAGEPVSIAAIDRVVSSLPQSIEEVESERWLTTSYCAHLFQKARERHPELFVQRDSNETWKHTDMDVIGDYMLEGWPRLDERTRSNIREDLSGTTSKFMLRPFSDIFCSGTCSFTPEQTFEEGKVVICDWPLLQFNETGRIVQVVLKQIFYRAWLRRDVEKHPRIVFCFADEAQLFMLPGNRENQFAQVSRSSGVANVWITQSIPNISEVLGETQIGSRTRALIGNLSGLHIYHQQNDVETQRFAADLVGKR